MRLNYYTQIHVVVLVLPLLHTNPNSIPTRQQIKQTEELQNTIFIPARTVEHDAA